MVKHTQTIRRQLPTNCLSVLDHFVGLALKVLSWQNSVMYSERAQNFKMKFCVKIVNSFRMVTIFAKSFFLDLWLGSEYIHWYLLKIYKVKNHFEKLKKYT